MGRVKGNLRTVPVEKTWSNEEVAFLINLFNVTQTLTTASDVCAWGQRHSYRMRLLVRKRIDKLLECPSVDMYHVDFLLLLDDANARFVTSLRLDVIKNQVLLHLRGGMAATPSEVPIVVDDRDFPRHVDLPTDAYHEEAAENLTAVKENASRENAGGDGCCVTFEESASTGNVTAVDQHVSNEGQNCRVVDEPENEAHGVTTTEDVTFRSLPSYLVPLMGPKKMSFRDVLAIWTVVYKIKRQYITELLQLLHKSGVDSTQLASLPKTWTTLLQDTEKTGRHRVIIRRITKKLTTSGDVRRFKASRSSVGHPRRRITNLLGRYIHFGLLAGSLMNSPGNIHYFGNLRILRLAYVMQPQLFTEQLFDATFVKGKMQQDNWPQFVEMMREKWPHHKNVQHAESVTLRLEFNVDGVAPFKSAKSGQFTPILARLTAIRGETGMFTLFGTKPFIVGFWLGYGEPPSRIFKDLANDLTNLHPSQLGRGRSRFRAPTNIEAFYNDCSLIPESENINTASSLNVDLDDCLEPIDADDEDDGVSGDTFRCTSRRRELMEDSELDSELDVVENDATTTLPTYCATVFSSVTVEIDRFVGDAPATAKMTGRVHHSGFWSGPRCRQRGAKLIVPQEQGTGKSGKPVYGPLHFPKMDCYHQLRKDENWERYMEVELEETTVNRAHVKRVTPLTNVPGILMVMHFVIDWMHTINGGVLEKFVNELSNAKESGFNRGQTKAGRRMKEFMNDVIKWYAEYMPDDIHRKITSLEDCSKWKMRERRNFIMYMAYAVMSQFAEDIKDGDYLLKQLQYLLHALRLVCGFSNQPLKPNALKEARWLLREFVKRSMEMHGNAYATWKVHQLLHILDDAEFYGCHAERNSADIYETFHQLWKQMFHPGPKAWIQLKNRLVELCTYRVPMDERRRITDTNVTTDSVQYVLKNSYTQWTNEIPSSTPKRIFQKRVRMQDQTPSFLQYEGFTLSTVFPQNVCQIIDNGKLSVVVCDSFEIIEHDFVVHGNEFKDVTSVYLRENSRTSSSRIAGLYEVARLSDEKKSWPGRSVKCKCVAFPYRIHEAEMDTLFKQVTPTTWDSWFIATMV